MIKNLTINLKRFSTFSKIELGFIILATFYFGIDYIRLLIVVTIWRSILYNFPPKSTKTFLKTHVELFSKLYQESFMQHQFNL